MEECGPCPVFASFILAFDLQLRKRHGETSVRVRKTSVRLRKTSVGVNIHMYIYKIYNILLHCVCGSRTWKKYCNKVTNGCNCLLYLFPLFLPYMFRALIRPSSGVSQAVFYIQPFGSCGVYVAHLRVPVDWFVVVVSL